MRLFKWGHPHTLTTGGLMMLAVVHNGYWFAISLGLMFVLGWASHAFYASAKSLVDHWLWTRKRNASSRRVARVKTETERIPF